VYTVLKNKAISNRIYYNSESIKSRYTFLSHKIVFRGSCNKSSLLTCAFKIISKILQIILCIFLFLPPSAAFIEVTDVSTSISLTQTVPRETTTLKPSTTQYFISVMAHLAWNSHHPHAWYKPWFKHYNGIWLPVTVAARSKAWTAFARSNTWIVGSNPTQGILITHSWIRRNYSIYRRFFLQLPF
jgi:hypothetical protein